MSAQFQQQEAFLFMRKVKTSHSLPHFFDEFSGCPHDRA